MTDRRRTLLTASLLSFALFVLLGLAVDRRRPWVAALDAPSAGIRRWAADRPWLEDSFLVVERVFSTQGLTVATIVVVGWLLLRRQVRAGVLVLVVMLAARELTTSTKELFGRDRPGWQDADFLHQASSYPSGHAAGVATLGGLLIVLAVMGRRSRADLGPVAAVVAVVVLVVCADRLMLGRHYVTDLVGGVLLGIGLVLLGLAVLHPVPEKQKERHPAGDAPSVVAQPVERELVLSRSA